MKAKKKVEETRKVMDMCEHIRAEVADLARCLVEESRVVAAEIEATNLRHRLEVAERRIQSLNEVVVKARGLNSDLRRQVQDLRSTRLAEIAAPTPVKPQKQKKKGKSS